MIILICMIIFALVGILIEKEETIIPGHEEYGFAAFTGGICGLCIGLLIFLVAAAAPGDTEVVNTTTISLEALSDNFSTSETFFLGTGCTDTDTYYYFIKKTRDGGYEMDKVKTDNAVLYYIKDGETPRLEYDEEQFSNPIHRFLGCGPIHIVYRIYIPKGSIVNNYNVDLQ